MLPDPFENQALFNVRGMVLLGKHLEPREHEEGTEHIEYPGERRDKRRPHADQDGAQHDDPDDAPEQHPVLVEAGNAQGAKDHGHDEDIVHGQRLLDHIAGEEFEPALRAARPPDPAAEGEGDGHVAAVKNEAFARRYFLGIAVQHAQVKHQQGHHHADEGEPEGHGSSQQVHA